MALVKLYRLQCEGVYLAHRKGRPAPAVEFLRVTCRVTVRELSETSKGARQTARRQGWTRRKVWIPILVSDSSAGSTEIAFDLCPNCTELLPS